MERNEGLKRVLAQLARRNTGRALTELHNFFAEQRDGFMLHPIERYDSRSQNGVSLIERCRVEGTKVPS
jgi:hypothetical protein